MPYNSVIPTYNDLCHTHGERRWMPTSAPQSVGTSTMIIYAHQKHKRADPPFPLMAFPPRGNGSSAVTDLDDPDGPLSRKSNPVIAGYMRARERCGVERGRPGLCQRLEIIPPCGEVEHRQVVSTY